MATGYTNDVKLQNGTTREKTGFVSTINGAVKKSEDLYLITFRTYDKKSLVVELFVALLLSSFRACFETSYACSLMQHEAVALLH